MLSRILREFEKVDEVLDLNELSHRLGVERSTLDGMLEFLVHKGKLREVVLGTETCAHCAGCLRCAQGYKSNLMGKTYELVK